MFLENLKKKTHKKTQTIPYRPTLNGLQFRILIFSSMRLSNGSTYIITLISPWLSNIYPPFNSLTIAVVLLADSIDSCRSCKYLSASVYICKSANKSPQNSGKITCFGASNFIRYTCRFQACFTSMEMSEVHYLNHAAFLYVYFFNSHPQMTSSWIFYDVWFQGKNLRIAKLFSDLVWACESLVWSGCWLAAKVCKISHHVVRHAQYSNLANQHGRVDRWNQR